MEKDETVEKITKIYCSKCANHSEFIGGKCEFCGDDLHARNIRTITLIFGSSVLYLLLGILVLDLEAFEFIIGMFFVFFIIFFIMSVVILLGSIEEKKK